MNAAIGKRLNIFFLTTGMSKAEFSRAVGISQQNLNGYFNGKHHPRILVESLYRMGCNLNWLIAGDGQMLRERISETEVLVVARRQIDAMLEEIAVRTKEALGVGHESRITD